MCWNWEVSLAFTVSISLGALWIFKRQSLGFKSTERDRWNSLLVLNLACVQFWEFLIWLTVYPRDADPSLCPKYNTAFTVMVYFHGVLLWPPIVNTLAYKTTKGRKAYFAFPLIYGCLYTLLGLVDIVYTHLFIPSIAITCGLKGEKLLQWHVALSQSRILPGGFDWFVFTVFPFIFYKPRPIGIFMFVYLIATFAIPYLLLTLGEAASIFCWLGVGIFLVFLIEPYIIHYFETRHPILLTYDPISTLLIKMRLKVDKSNLKKKTRLRSPMTSNVEDSGSDNDTVDTELEMSKESNEVELAEV